jgi:hypothetical protein
MLFFLIFSKAFVWNISHSKRNWAKYDPKRVRDFTKSTSKSCQSWMKFEFSRQIFEKYSNIKFREKSVQWNPSCSTRMDGRTDEQTDTTKLIVAFRNFANARNKNSISLLSLLITNTSSVCLRPLRTNVLTNLSTFSSSSYSAGSCFPASRIL